MIALRKEFVNFATFKTGNQLPVTGLRFSKARVFY
jgi:hypothetical protein